MLDARAVIALVVGCGSTAQPVSSIRARPSPLCGFTSFDELDAAAWKAAHESATDVGSCKLHAIDAQVFVVRDGNVDVAKLTRHGTMVLVPGMAVAGFMVGMSSDEVLAHHPPDQFRIWCFQDALGSQCAFRSIAAEGNARHTFAVTGDPRGRLDGIAAFEFFRGKSLVGIQAITRPDW